MTASVGGEAKDKEKETTPVEDAKPGVGQWVTSPSSPVTDQFNQSKS